MQVHGPSSSGDKISVSLNPGDGSPFAVIYIDTLRIYVQSPEEADRIVSAGAEAKRLLLNTAAGEGDSK